MPTWNEKIKVILWHCGDGYFDSEKFIANVPEHPSAYDVMNIATLHSKEGRMVPAWFNLYGIRPKEDTGTISLLHSSAYLGRILMSFHLVNTERP